MQVSRLTIGTHAVLSAHLASEFSTATLTFRDGRELKLIGVNAFRRDRIVAQGFGEEDACTFFPGDVVGVEMAVLDPEMMAPSEMRDFGLTVSDVHVTNPESGSAGAQAEK